MKSYGGLPALIPLPLLAGYAISAAMAAIPPDDSADIARLLAEAKTEAFELRHDSEDLRSYSRSGLNVSSHASKIAMIREHINNTGKLLKKLQDAAPGGSPWQQATIRQIDPLLRQLADNTGKTIRYFNENKSKVHFREFQDYIAMNDDLAVELETMIRKAVDYGEMRERFEQLSTDLEPGK